MSLSQKIKSFLQKYKHIWVFSYGLIYLPWFFWLEHHVTTDYHVIHCSLDDKIPFIEFFIIPYLLWFFFIAAVALYFFFTDTAGFYRLCIVLAVGMTAFLLISTVYPNGLALRPTVFSRDNIFTDMVRTLYAADTPTNVLPSIHVYNTLASCFAISHSEALKKHRIITGGAYVLSALIILATMFLKQHSVIDVCVATAMAYLVRIFVYMPAGKKVVRVSRQTV